MINKIKTFFLNRKLKKRRKASSKFFRPENLVKGSEAEHISPSGKYKLKIQQYKTKKGYFEFSQGTVYPTEPQPPKNEEIKPFTFYRNKKYDPYSPIAVIQRNYGSFWHTWITHKNRNEYLLCGEDYQGYSVVNLTWKTVQHYLPPSALDGAGFCWMECIPSPSRTKLAVFGCYWAFPEEIVIYDFINPDRLPLPEIKRLDFDGIGNLNSFEWADNDSISVKFAEDYSIPDDKLMDDILEEDTEKFKKLYVEHQVKEVEKEVIFQI